MATDCCSPVKFYCLNETAFYFVDAETDGDVVGDAFHESFCGTHPVLVRCNNNKFLILSDENEFQAQTLTGTEPECKFNIKIYKDNRQDGKKGRAVMLYANKDDGKKMTVSCNDRHEIYPQEMVKLPEEIDDTRHSAVFYRTEVSSCKFRFESSMYQNEFLGFEPEKDNQTLCKLVLLPVGQDEVDESCDIFCSQ